MPIIDNFSAWIEVEGKQLPEYLIQPSASGAQLIRTCWIPSEAGKEFKILFKDTLGDIDTCTRITVDGIHCTGRIIRRTAATRIAVHDGETTSATTYKPYVFSNCQLTEDEDVIGPATANLGEIVVDVDEVVVQGVSPWQHSRPATLPPLNVHERAKKGIVHGTQLGKEVSLTESRVTASITIIRKLLSFRFKYRPLAVLKADGIAPQDQPAPIKRQADPEDIIDLTVEDEGQGGERRRKKARVSRIAVKKERSTTFDDGEVLDLTT